MTENGPVWKLRLNTASEKSVRGRAELRLAVLFCRCAHLGRLLISTIDECVTPQLVDPNGNVVAEGAVDIKKHLGLIRQSVRA